MNKLFWMTALFVTMPFLSFADDTSVKSFNAKTAKIIGGVKSPLGAWPSTVALLNVSIINAVESGTATDSTGALIPISEANYQAQGCGASLIASNWVLTAAHCVVDNTGVQISASAITTLVGTSDLLNGGERISVKRIIVHPSYNNSTTDSDIALLELVSATSVTTIGFADIDIPTGILATVVGWGALDDSASPSFPSSLYEVDVPIVDRTTCDAVFNSSGSTLFTNNMLCAGYAAGGKDTCQADSGGPLMANYGGELVQVGITSWGVGCAQPGLYGVYTRLYNFQGWVDSYVNGSVASASGGGGSFFFLLLPFLLLVSVRPLVKSQGEKHENS